MDSIDDGDSLMIPFPFRSPAIWLLCLGLLLPGLVARAGLLAEGTRVIYPTASHGQRLIIANTNPWPVLVQVWADQGEGDPEAGNAPFVVLPAVFRLEPSATRSLSIFYTGEPLPEGRESLFWLNLHEIPPVNSDADDAEARLTLTLNTQLKLFYRPQGVGVPDNLAAQLQFRLEQQHGHWCVWVHNPTAWHASISALSVDGINGPLLVDEADLLLPPATARCYRLREGGLGEDAAVHFSLIGDAGFSEEYDRALRTLPP